MFYVIPRDARLCGLQLQAAMSRRFHNVSTIDTACFSERRLTAIPSLQRFKTSTLDETERR
jgi:hypothetical protein